MQSMCCQFWLPYFKISIFIPLIHKLSVDIGYCHTFELTDLGNDIFFLKKAAFLGETPLRLND